MNGMKNFLGEKMRSMGATALTATDRAYFPTQPFGKNFFVKAGRLIE